jgi:D-cysteine desulfhydrase family pyridoxal phosphate-dependent enzyme
MNSVRLSKDTVRSKLAEFPRYRLAQLPTALEPLPRLSSLLGINLWIKRDDLTGLAFGGNKTRKIEYVMADAIEQNCDVVITWGGVQSNWCRQVAAAARKCGLGVILVLLKKPGSPNVLDGNLLVDFLCDAEVDVIEMEQSDGKVDFSAAWETVESLAARERSAGRKPYVVSIGASLLAGSMTRPLGAVAYVNAALEIMEQSEQLSVSFQSIVLATGSGSTQAGLITGASLLGWDARVIGISVSDNAATMQHDTELISQQTLREFGVSFNLPSDEFRIFDHYIDGGYGVLNRVTAEALRLLAQTEGLLLDPVYSGRAMVGLFDLLKKGIIRPGENVIFLHTGGTPALFPYRDELQAFLSANAETIGLRSWDTDVLSRT